MANNHSAEWLRGAIEALDRARRDFTVTVPELQAEYVALLAAAEAREAFPIPDTLPEVPEARETGESDSIKLAKLIDGMFYCEGGGYDSDDVREGIQKAFEIGVQSAGKMKQACDRHREAYKVAERERVALVKRSHNQRIEIKRLIEQLTAATARAEAAEKEVERLRGALEEARKDNDELDGTDAAHPAWWRGNDAGVSQACAKINAILDGADVFGTASEPWESARRRVAEARKDSDRLEWCIKHGAIPYETSRAAIDAARGAK